MKVFAASVRASVAEVVGNVMVVPSVPLSVIVFVVVRVLAFEIVRAPVLVLIVRPLREVAVATPKTGVTRVGEVVSTAFPVPFRVP